MFFGSSADSVIVLSALSQLTINNYQLSIASAVTQPPKAVGRNHNVTPTPVEIWAKEHGIPTLSFASNPSQPWFYENEHDIIDTLQPLDADLLISASYGQKIPTEIIETARYGGLNVHPSLLPRWRGADPVPWAILSGDTQTGVTIVTLSPRFDEGNIIAQKKLPITDTDSSDPLRTRLFMKGATLIAQVLPDYLSGNNTGQPQQSGSVPMKQFPYARRLTRQDGFEPWDTMFHATNDEAQRIHRKLRALTPWPGLWSTLTVQGCKKRLKIRTAHIDNHSLHLDSVQLEGKRTVAFTQFQSAYLSGTT